MDNNQQDQILENQIYLKILTIFHYIIGGMYGSVCIASILITFNLFFLLATDNNISTPKIEILSSFTGIIYILIIYGLWSLSLVIAGYFIARRKKRLFCLVAAGCSCIFIPLGTILGITTIVLLIRPSIKQLFLKQPA